MRWGPGFVGDPDLFGLAVLLTQITMPYLMMMSLSAMLSGVLNSHGKFAVAAAAPVLLNLTLIGILAFSRQRAESWRSGCQSVSAYPVSRS